MPTLIDPHEVDDGSDNDEKPEDGREFDDDDELFGDIGAGEDFVTLARVADGESNEQADVGNPVDIGVVEGGGFTNNLWNQDFGPHSLHNSPRRVKFYGWIWGPSNFAYIRSRSRLIAALYGSTRE